MTAHPRELKTSRILVVGASLAGLRTVEALRDLGFTGTITIVGDEIHPPYERPPLSKTVISGVTAPEETALPLRSDLDCDWQLGRRATGLDLERRLVTVDDYAKLPFDALVLATGARARIPGAWVNINGIHLLRTVDDAVALRAALRKRPRRVAVLGAGFIGSEVTASIREIDLPVTLVDSARLPLEQAVGGRVAEFVAGLHRTHGVELRTETTVVETVCVDGDLAGLRLSDGSLIDVELAIVGFGVTPNTEWLQSSGIALDRGVVCDETLRARTANGTVSPVVAVGDIARWPHPLAAGAPIRIEHWSNAATHGAVAARTLMHHLNGAPGGAAACDAVPSFWSNLYDAKLLAVGLPGSATASAVLAGDLAAGRSVIGYGRGGQLVGAVAVNDPRTLAHYRRLIAAGSPWPPAPPPPRVVSTSRSSQEPAIHAQEPS